MNKNDIKGIISRYYKVWEPGGFSPDLISDFFSKWGDHIAEDLTLLNPGVLLEAKESPDNFRLLGLASEALRVTLGIWGHVRNNHEGEYCKSCKFKHKSQTAKWTCLIFPPQLNASSKVPFDWENTEPIRCQECIDLFGGLNAI